MIQKIKTLLGFKRKKNRQLIFRCFFTMLHRLKRKKLLGSVVKEANKDQRDLIKRYSRI